MITIYKERIISLERPIIRCIGAGINVDFQKNQFDLNEQGFVDIKLTGRKNCFLYGVTEDLFPELLMNSLEIGSFLG